LEPQKHAAARPVRDPVDNRRQPRFKLETQISINSRTCGQLNGHTVDISESGISAILLIEVPLHEVVELEFTLPLGPVKVYAMVRQRNAFRYGFQFVETDSARQIIHATCRQLDVEQALLGDL
jgi:hypothetical protein